jgi:hypothetical protein
MHLSLEAGEMLAKSFVRAIPIFLVMLIFYKLRKIDRDSKQNQSEDNREKDKPESVDKIG